MKFRRAAFILFVCCLFAISYLTNDLMDKILSEKFHPLGNIPIN